MASKPSRLLARVLPLVANRACVLTPQDAVGAGGDVDCAVCGLEPLWPLRLQPPYRLLRATRYDGPRGRLWLVAMDEGGTLLLDTLEDARGAGELAFPTALVAACPSLFAPLHLSAAYLALKRVRAGEVSEEEAARLRALAAVSPTGFRTALEQSLGAVGAALAAAILSGRLDASLAARARRAQALRTERILALLHALADSARLALERLRRPTGLRVLLVGPDGAGKSLLAEALPTACADLFHGSVRRNWRPGLLPQPGTVLRTPAADPATPHDRRAHGRALSYALLLYYMLDFLLGERLVYRWAMMRTRLVVVERGWADVEVDPIRYRLRVPSALVRLVAKALPRYDLVLLLDAPPHVIRARKRELARGEIERQSAAWRVRLASLPGALVLDASKSPADVAAQARAAVVEELEARAVARLGPGWAAIPRTSPRLWLPRGPRRVVRAATAVSAPKRSRWVPLWQAAQVGARLGAFRLLPRGPAPPRAVRALLAEHVPRGGTYAVACATAPERFVALLMSRDGMPNAFVKVALDEEGRAALDRETRRIDAFAPLLPQPLRTPRIRAAGDGLLLLEPERVIRPVIRRTVPPAVASALGRFFRAGTTGARGPVHGDFAPWNLLPVRDGWLLVDWEDARPDGLPFEDLFHFFLQARSYLGWPPPSELVRGLEGEGAVGAALNAFAQAAGRPLSDARDTLHAYLDESERRLADLLRTAGGTRSGPGTRAELSARRELRPLLGKRS